MTFLYLFLIRVLNIGGKYLGIFSLPLHLVFDKHCSIIFSNFPVSTSNGTKMRGLQIFFTNEILSCKLYKVCVLVRIHACSELNVIELKEFSQRSAG